MARGSRISLRVVQIPGEVDTLLDESADPLLDENGDALLTESPAYASLAMFDIEGLAVTVETVTTVTFNTGPDWVLSKVRTLTVTDREFSPGAVAITLTDVEDERLNTLFPPHTYTADDFPALGEADSGRAVPRILGTALKLRGAIELMPDELSGGMKRRVALARAIALDPQILMYDEPFVGQDPIAMGVLVRLIRLLNDALGITSIVVSHDLAETASIADYIYVVGDGQVLGQGTPDELMNSDEPRIRQFMTGNPDGPVPYHFPATDYRADLLGKR